MADVSTSTNSSWMVVEWMPSVWKNDLIWSAMRAYSISATHRMCAVAMIRLPDNCHTWNSCTSHTPSTCTQPHTNSKSHFVVYRPHSTGVEGSGFRPKLPVLQTRHTIFTTNWLNNSTDWRIFIDGTISCQNIRNFQQKIYEKNPHLTVKFQFSLKSNFMAKCKNFHVTLSSIFLLSSLTLMCAGTVCNKINDDIFTTTHTRQSLQQLSTSLRIHTLTVYRLMSRSHQESNKSNAIKQTIFRVLNDV